MRTFTTDEKLAEIVKNSISWAGVIKACGSVVGGGSYQHYQNRIKKLGLDISHFLGQRAHTGIRHTGKGRKFHWSEVLVDQRKEKNREKSTRLRRAFQEYCEEKKISVECVDCGLKDKWNGKPFQLEINHIDECRWNNIPDNLEWICPNCHSTKTNY